MVDPGEPLTVTLIREFGEEACNTLEVSPEKKIDIMHKLSQLFSKGTAVSTFEPCRKKTGLQGFRPGPTQTRLYSHRRWLGA